MLDTQEAWRLRQPNVMTRYKCYRCQTPRPEELDEEAREAEGAIVAEQMDQEETGDAEQLLGRKPRKRGGRKLKMR